MDTRIDVVSERGLIVVDPCK